ncbi:MAG: hypothetical protein R2854_11815 [Caldilineaceae bacterium]
MPGWRSAAWARIWRLLDLMQPGAHIVIVDAVVSGVGRARSITEIYP